MVGMDHAVALVGLLWLPPTVIAFLVLVDLLARSNVALAGRFLDRFAATPQSVKFAVLLMSAAAAIHASLVATHIAEDPFLAAMFATYSVTLFALCVGAFLVDGWRVAAILVLAGGIAAYVFYVSTGRESVDVVGLASKVVEAAAVVLLVIRRRSIFVGDGGSEIVTATASQKFRR